MQSLVDPDKEFGLCPKNKKPFKGFTWAGDTTTILVLDSNRAYMWRMDYWTARVEGGKPDKILGHDPNKRK